MKMQWFLLGGFFVSAFIYVCTEEMISEGTWSMIGLEKCPEEELPMTLGLKKLKLNRTHDCFNANISLTEDIDVLNFGMHVEICKHMDGGCKLYTVFDDKSFCNVVNKYAKENFVKILTAAGIQPADCPIPKGEYFVEKYYFDYEELPENNLLGDFSAKVQLLKHGKTVACVIFEYRFEKKDDKK